MGKKAGPNDPCPCGSGKKRKKCCGAKGAVVGFTHSDRSSAYRKLSLLAEEFGEEDDAAFREAWGSWWDDDRELPEELDSMSEAVVDGWFFFDRPLDGEETLADVALDQLDLAAGERNFIRMARTTAMHLYEVEDAVPGVSLTLRDVLEGHRVTVCEKLGSRTIARYAWLAARLVPRGPSGGPEIEHLLPIADMLQEPVRRQLAAMRADVLLRSPGDVQSLYKELPPFFHDAWVSSILDPQVPQLANTDGETIVWTRVSFDVLDQEHVMSALDAMGVLERGDGMAWGWTGSNARGETVSLGHVKLDEKRLVLEANSAERAQRGRTIIEEAVGQAARHRSTTHEDPTRSVKEALRNRALGGAADEGPGDPAIPREVVEALTLNHYGRHYRAWLDDSIPALEGSSPRVAAKDARLQPKLVDLLHQLEGAYQKALMRGEPAYDPSWMWAELGLDEGSAPAHPPPLAHERVAEIVPGIAEISRSVAEAARARPSFTDQTTVLDPGEIGHNLDIQRFLRGLVPPDPDASVRWAPDQIPPYLNRMVNHDLHRRKVFWVDEGLSWQLSNTDLDALGRELRVPFTSFALVFTDRRMLSLGERLLSKDPKNPLAGHFLRVATVYVTEHGDGDVRTLSVCFALDALGADLPQLVSHELVLRDETGVHKLIEQAGPPPVVTDPPVEDASPLRALLQTVVNAILYATSAAPEPVLRNPNSANRKRTSPREPAEIKTSSESVYFLPGAIEISQLRRLQSLERIPDGRTALHRFMVRGHWRRPAKSWTDQRLRWIEPYWKGPDMASVIERAYKLSP
jgi:hypothetical protein